MNKIQIINHRQVRSLSKPIYEILSEKFNKKLKEQEDKVNNATKEIIEALDNPNIVSNDELINIKKERESFLNEIHKISELLNPIKELITEDQWDSSFSSTYYENFNRIVPLTAQYLEGKEIFSKEFKETTNSKIKKKAEIISRKLLGIYNPNQSECNLVNEINARLSLAGIEPYDTTVNKIVSEIDINKFFKPQ